MMSLDWQNVSILEVWWTSPAVIGLLVTAMLLFWATHSFSAIRSKVRNQPTLYRAWGRRWNFSLILVLAMAAFCIAWVIGITLGVVAMLTPPPVAEANREAATWFAWLFIFRDIMFMFAETLIWVALRLLADAPVLPEWMMRVFGKKPDARRRRTTRRIE